MYNDLCSVCGKPATIMLASFGATPAKHYCPEHDPFDLTNRRRISALEADVTRLRTRIQDALDTSWGDRGGERSAADALDDVRAVLTSALSRTPGRSEMKRDGL